MQIVNITVTFVGCYLSAAVDSVMTTGTYFIKYEGGELAMGLAHHAAHGTIVFQGAMTCLDRFAGTGGDGAGLGSTATKCN